MTKVFLSLLLFLSLLINAFSQDLPNYMTEKEAELYKSYIPPTFNADDINPPLVPVRTMAEWEEFQGILITWTSYTQILAQIVDYAQDEGFVLIVCSDSNSVKNTLTSYGVPLVNLKFLYASYNSVWCRDYGQWCVYSYNADSLKFIDWIYNRPRPLDDQIPVYVSNYIGVPLHQTTTSPNNFIATGGNFMVDGNGTAFSSKLIINENPTQSEANIDTIVKKYMGITRYIKMNTLPYDGIHHIDMHMKLLDEETLMVGQYPLGVSDGPQIEANLAYIQSNFLTCYGRPYKIVRIPQPPSSSGQYPPNSSYFTYTNSLIVNKTVLVPIYGFALDTTALRIYRQAMPGYRVIGIDCNASIPSSGAIHCITKEIGVYEPIFISHASIRSALSTEPNYEVKAYIKTRSGVANAKCYWTTDTTAGFQQLNMSAVGDTFKAYIPPQALNSKVYYYITASSNSGRSIKKPITAPSGNYRFDVMSPSVVGSNGEGQFIFELMQNYPNPFNQLTNIKYQITNKSLITIKVFDITGKEITTLVNEEKPAGKYSIKFDTGNLPSGIYFYTLSSGDFKETKKMILIK